MPEKNEFKLPASLVRESGIASTPMRPKHQGLNDIMAFAGIAKGVWGYNPEEVAQTIRDNRATWEPQPLLTAPQAHRIRQR